MFSCEFCEIFKNNFLKNTSVRLLLDRIQCNNTKLIQINMKHNYILPLSSSLSSKCYFSLLLKTTFRSTRSETFFKIGRLKHFPIFTGKHLCRNIFITKRLQLRIFPMNNGGFLTTTFFYRTPPVTCFWTFLSFSIIFFLLCLPIAIE